MSMRFPIRRRHRRPIGLEASEESQHLYLVSAYRRQRLIGFIQWLFMKSSPRECDLEVVMDDGREAQPAAGGELEGRGGHQLLEGDKESDKYCPSPLLVHSFCMQHQVTDCASSAATDSTAYLLIRQYRLRAGYTVEIRTSGVKNLYKNKSPR
jgi:hypothetical protein